jgi:hypothetical protein
VLHYIYKDHEPRICIPQTLKQHYLQHCYWPKMRQDISHYIRQCPTCQHIKNDTIKAGTLAPITISHPYELVGWDLMGPFPTSKSGNQHILVMIEYLTRWCEAEPLSDISASTIATALLKKVIFPHGCPIQLLSDQGL